MPTNSTSATEPQAATRETVKPSEIQLGDLIVYYGVYFRISGARCYPGLPGEETSMPCYSFDTDLIWHPGPGCTMPLHWARDWKFQGNDRAAWTRVTDKPKG